MASYVKAVTGTAVMARSANEEKKKIQTWLNQKLVSDQLKLKSILNSWLSTNPEQLEVSIVCLKVSCQLGLKSK